MSNMTYTLTEDLTMFIILSGFLPSMDSLVVKMVSVGTESLPTLMSPVMFLTNVKYLILEKDFILNESLLYL